MLYADADADADVIIVFTCIDSLLDCTANGDDCCVLAYCVTET